MKRIIALIAVLVVLATVLILPLSAIEIGFCTNVNFFNVSDVIGYSNYYEQIDDGFEWSCYLDSKGQLDFSVSLPDEVPERIILKLYSSGLFDSNWDWGVTVSSNVRYCGYFEYTSDLDISLALVSVDDDSEIYWDFDEVLIGYDTEEIDFCDVIYDQTLAVIINNPPVDEEYLEFSIYNIQVNEMCNWLDCDYCDYGDPKPYNYYSTDMLEFIEEMELDRNGRYQSAYKDGYTAGEAAGLTTGYNNGYSAGEAAGSTVGYNNGYSAGEDAGLITGYNNGYSAGVTAGVTIGYNDGYGEGKTEGFNNGYSAGEQSTVSKDIVSIIGEIAMAPYTAISAMFDFEIFGLNVAGLIFQFVTTVVFLLVVGLIFKYLF